MNLKIFMWNAQGCGHRNFLRFTRQYHRDHSPDIVGFVETRISNLAADKVIAALNFPFSYRVEANGFSGGIWLCWNENVQVDILFSHFQFIHCRIHCKSSLSSFLATFVYASPNSSKRKHLWSYLTFLSSRISEPWITLGDFNATISNDERLGCTSSTDRDFITAIFDSKLHDLGYEGPAFTWYRGQRAVRLDRCMCNDHWIESYPETLVHHLLRMKSDHRPLFVTIGHQPPRSKHRRFHYFSGWLQHADFNQLVLNNWDSNLPITTAVEQFCKVVDSWNRNVFGSLTRRKNHVMARLRGIQRCLSQRRNAFLSNLEADLQLELETILDQEELLWKQKSRCDWIAFGDRNTSYFHKRAIINKRKNRISKLQLSTGEWCDDDEVLHNEAVTFFQNLFSIGNDVQGTFPISGYFPTIPFEDMQCLDHVTK
ncbi:hypothetical protein V6N13_146482 [Hibiscus sabdariffa]